MPHPTGYPLYLGLGAAFQRALPFGSAAWKANLLSAVFGAAAIAALVRLMLLLRVAAAGAVTAALCLAFTPTFWRHSVVAEVYSLHAFLLTSVAFLFLRWAETRAPRDFYWSCALYALAFGNHLLMLTLLPAVTVLVLRVEPRAFREAPRVARVLLLIGAGAAQYLLLWLRARDPSTPYRAAEMHDLASLLAFVTGAQFRSSMLAFSPSALLFERLPSFLGMAASELGPLLLLVPLGVLAIGRTHANAFLALAFVGNLAFALSYDIQDLSPYFIPNLLVASVWLGAGLARATASVPAPARAALAVVLPMLVASVHFATVEREKGSDAARRAEMLAAELPTAALVVTGYHEYQYLTYLKLVEGRGGPTRFAAHLLEPETVAAYVRDGVPIELEATRATVPPGLPVFSAKLNHRSRYRAAGLEVEPWSWGVLRLTRSTGDP